LKSFWVEHVKENGEKIYYNGIFRVK